MSFAALAQELYLAGCKLLITGRDQKKLEQLRKKLETLQKNDNPIKLIRLDLENLESIQQAVNEAVDAYDRIDYLINNAGISYRGRAEATESEVYRRLMETNFFGQISLTRGKLKNH